MANDNLRSSINLLTDKNIVTADTSLPTYNYYGYVAKDGSWTILREKQDNTEYLYAVGGSNFEDNWDNRETLDYQAPNEFPRA